MLTVEAHSLLDHRAFISEFPKSLGEIQSPDDLSTFFTLDASSPFEPDDGLKKKVRDLLRVGGFKPAGRSKPASEYLIKASSGGFLGAINLAVDICNIVSLHSGLPISVVDLDKAKAPLRLAIAEAGSRYIFNHSGQEIDVSGLLCLHDGVGPCANAVKDCQRTKTGPETTRVLTVIWGTNQLPGRSDAAMQWYLQWLEKVGATITPLPHQP